MSKVLEGVTIETFPEIVQQGRIRPGQRFAIVLDGEHVTQQPKLAEIAARMRSAAAERGMTTEIFDAIIAEN